MQAKLAGKSQLGIMQMRFFLAFCLLRKKGSKTNKRTTEEQIEKQREIAGRGQPEKCGPRCHVAAENEQTKSSSSGKPPRGSIATVSRLAPLCQGNDGHVQQTMRWPVGYDWSTTGLESEREGLSKCPWPRTMASCIRPMHLQIRCQYRCTELEIVGFGQRRCYSLESKPSTRISVGGERRKTSGQPSRREQFCGNALVTRARLVDLLGQKRKARGFPSVPKGGLQTSVSYDCTKSKPIIHVLVGLRFCRWEVWGTTTRKGREKK